MPILQGALLCDAAHEYSGLVSILGGFVSATLVGAFPAHASIYFAGRVAFAEDELDRPHTIVVTAENEDGLILGEVRAAMPAGAARVVPAGAVPIPEIASGANLCFPFPFPLTRPGMYWVVLRVDGDDLVRLPLKVMLADPASGQ